jgi:hypothetical protein
MQGELDAHVPNLNIRILGVNEWGQEAGNAGMTEGRSIPWLQDVDSNGDGLSDVWYNQWHVVFRDVVILNTQNTKVGTFNLTEHNLADPQNYESLRQQLIDVASQEPPWRNPVTPLDVNGDTFITAVGDVLRLVNELNNHYVSDASGLLPIPPPTEPPPYLDVNGDGFVTAVGDVLPVINYLNHQATGEGEATGLPDLGGPTLVVTPVAGHSSPQVAGDFAAADASSVAMFGTDVPATLNLSARIHPQVDAATNVERVDLAGSASAIPSVSELPAHSALEPLLVDLAEDLARVWYQQELG